METHVKVLGILRIIFGALGIVIGLVVLLVLGGIGVIAGTASRDADAVVAIPILGGIGVFVFALVAVLSIPGIIAGFGLLKHRPWARILTIVLSALDLFSVPFGTALGIYGLWVLLSNDGQRVFAQPPVRY